MNLPSFVKENADSNGKPWLKPTLLTLGGIIIIAGIIAVGIFLYTKNFEEKIYPNVFIDKIDLGGLTQQEASDILRAQYNGMLEEGLSIASPKDVTDFQTVENIDLRLAGATDPDLVRDTIQFNPDGKATQAFNVGRKSSAAINVLTALLQVVKPTNIDPEVTIDADALESEIRNLYDSYENPGDFTDYVVSFGRSDVAIEINEGSIGQILDMDLVLEQIQKDAQDFFLDVHEVTLIETENPVSVEEAAMLTDDVRSIIEAAPYVLTYTSEDLKEYTWEIEKSDIADWILPWKDSQGQVELIIEEEKIENFYEEMGEDVNVAPTNARFVIEDGRVSEFAGSLNGVELDQEKTHEKLMAALGDDQIKAIEIAVSTVEPTITTGSVNDFGIKEILGVGTSDFSGSPYNRIQNIKHGASKLNGLLIAPGETISLVEHLKPFTMADGYLPELVIKGDEIKPEIGGGLCQIGTTTFRATMNAGLEVTERRNHSLVVSYYDDATNGNPGTDATIYDPNPDYKFTNSYDNYILLTTEVDEPNRMLYFTFWGTDDGRNGYYDPPTVLSWRGYGPAEYIDTEDLAPGVTKCQYPHPGALTSFNYYIEWPDGSVTERNFTSEYRSLPKICLVGVDGSGGGGDASSDADELDVEDVPIDESEVE